MRKEKKEQSLKLTYSKKIFNFNSPALCSYLSCNKKILEYIYQLEKLMIKLDESNIEKPQQRRSIIQVTSGSWYKSIGCLCQNNTSVSGFSTPHNFRKNSRGESWGRKENGKHLNKNDLNQFGDIWNLMKKLIGCYDPKYVEHDEFALALIKNGKAKRHADYMDIKYQYLISLGDFTGGKLRVYHKNGKYVDDIFKKSKKRKSKAESQWVKDINARLKFLFSAYRSMVINL